MERFIDYNFDKIKKKAKKILFDKLLIPLDCPKETCLYLSKITLRRNEINLLIDANPPQLPTTKPELYKYETDPICEKQCQILANPNRCFQIKQNSKTGEILSIKAEWVSNN